jgi:dUTP pyrophosphatase
MKIKIKKLHKDAIIPTYAKPGDAGMDLTAVKADANTLWDYITYHTGLAIEIPEGYVGLLFPRSSVYKTEQLLSNSVGVIDSGYRGEIMLKYTRGSAIRKTSYKPGDRVGQLIILPYPQVHFLEVESLSETERGEGGYGSTGT